MSQTVIVISAADEDEAWEKLVTTRTVDGKPRTRQVSRDEAEEEYCARGDQLHALPETVEAIDVTPNDLRALYHQVAGGPLMLTARVDRFAHGNPG